MAFEKFWSEKAEYDKTHKVEMVKVVPPAQSPAFNKSVLLQSIDNVDSMDDATLRQFIDINFESILQNVFNGLNTIKHIKCFQNVKFLDAFIDVLIERKFFNKDVILQTNIICYHYITSPKEIRDPMVENRILKISSIINRSNLPKLLGLGLSDNLANTLLIARYSDMNFNIVVKRINFIIITQPSILMTVKIVEEIFRSLFDVMVDFPMVFIYFMLDVLPQNTGYDPNAMWVTEEIEEVNSNMNLAILNILDNLPSPVIKYTLENYSGSMTLNNRPVRFSINRLSDDYYRINNILAQLRSEGIICP